MRTTLSLDDALLAKAIPKRQASVATEEEVLRFVDDAALFGMGIGYVDAHLLAATRLTPNAYLITHDRRLRDAANRLNLSAKQVS